jgi:thiol-disulfide isomerase/thioredoxin
MKKIMTTGLLLLMLNAAKAQAQYEITTAVRHSQQKVLRGIINKYLVMNDDSFANWYKTNHSGYAAPDSTILNAMERAGKSNIQFVVFGGTWCEDTQFILPRFFRLQEMTGIKDDQITLFGVNEDKKSLGSIATAFGITNVPTIIVMKDNKEVGRVIEYGKTGKWDKELAELIR